MAEVRAGAWCWLVAQGCARFGYDALPDESGSETPVPCSDGVDGGEPSAECGTPPACPSGGCLPSATCSDGVQNQDETAVDCGGTTCAPCPSCSDSKLGQEETGVDCGGPSCDPCPESAPCQSASDCLSLSCSADGSCAAATCSDGIQNQGETSVDCGGECAACPSCSDRARNQDETGLDCGGASCAACGVNTPPLVAFSVTPGLGSHDGTPATLFLGDASATTDREDPADALAYAWDWDDDGAIDATGVNASHSYPTAGTFTVRLSVQDNGGLTATHTSIVIVSSESSILRVTTAVDENQDGATPASPGGTGLSLREAIAFANGAAGRQSILVPAGFAIDLDSQLPNPTAPLGMDIVGDGVRIDGSGTNPADDCMVIASPDNRVFGLEFQNCNRSPLRLLPGAAGSHFSRLKIHDNAQPVVLADDAIHFGPHNEVSRAPGYCVSVLGPNTTLDWNYIHDCEGRGVDLTGNSDGALLLGNVVARCDPAVLFGSGADNLRLVHNVLHGNRSDGLLAGMTGAGVILQNNVFSGNAAFGVRGADSVFSNNDHNAYFANALGTCTACSLGTGSLSVDPRFMDANADDFRLQPDSPLIDAGIDTGNDLNGPASGSFTGATPDIGARETP